MSAQQADETASVKCWSAQLTRDSYDGEADDPPPPTKVEPEAKPEPEAAPAPDATEDMKEENNEDDVTFKTEPDQVMSEPQQQQAPAQDDDYDRPLQIKEDG